MPTSINPRNLRDAQDLVVWVKGRVGSPPWEPTLVADPSKLERPAKALKPSRLSHAIQKGLAFVLEWQTANGRELIMPIEDRGFFDFDWFSGLVPPKDATGPVLLTPIACEGERYFSFVIEFSKVGV